MDNIDINIVNFPEWAKVKEENDQALKNKKYDGYTWQRKVTLDMYVLIDCQNDECVGMGENCIRFAWCNKAGFAIASVKYQYSEAGYIAGCQWLLKSAIQLQQTFEQFIKENMHTVAEWIKTYNSNYTEKKS